jgi:TRAP transporter TAXI family solute receptor
MILGGLGLDATSVVSVPARSDEAVRQLAAGSLDALFVTGIDPLDAVTQATTLGARLVALDGPGIDRLRRAYPFFSRAVIPAGTYPHQAEGVRTIGVDSVLLCRSGLSEPLVHDLTQRLFQVLPLLSPSEAFASRLDLEQAPATPIPLHEGAARYYRERELLR